MISMHGGCQLATELIISDSKIPFCGLYYINFTIAAII